MGNYIICAKEIHSGTSIDDIENPLEVTEIATELVITRLYCLMMLNDGTISKTDTIVTTSERKCLYENIFDNVIEMGLDFDQMINEFDYKWIHISYNSNKNRKQILR